MADEKTTTVKKTFLGGAVILGIAGIVIKVLGAFFRIPLGNIIGTTGMAYYQAAYPVYNLFLSLSTAGIPIAISRMVSERSALNHRDEAHRVFQISLKLLGVIGILSAAVMYFASTAIATNASMPLAQYSFRAIAPALLVVPIMAAFRGYFQGMQNMKPTAISQVVEQLFRVALGLTLAIVLTKKGVEYAAAGASFGATAGGIGGLAIILLIYGRSLRSIRTGIRDSEPSAKETAGQILKQILVIAIPITIGSAIMPIMNSIDMAIVVKRLVVGGFTEARATELYGELSGYAGALINFPQVLTQAVAMSLVPAVAAANKTGDMEFLRKNVSLGYRMAMMIGLPCAAGMMSLAAPVLRMFYPSRQESAVSAASCLFVLAFGVIFLSTVQMLTSVLQGVGKQMIPVRNLAIGAVAKFLCTYFLTPIPFFNVKGAAAGTVLCYIIASALNMIAVKKYTGTKFDFGLTFGKPLISCLVMVAAVLGVYHGLTAVVGSTWKANALATVIAVGVGILVYALMILVTKAVTPEELERMPKGGRFARIASKFVRK